MLVWTNVFTEHATSVPIIFGYDSDGVDVFTYEPFLEGYLVGISFRVLLDGLHNSEERAERPGEIRVPND
jgi:hypothetical protein